MSIRRLDACIDDIGALGSRVFTLGHDDLAEGGCLGAQSHSGEQRLPHGSVRDGLRIWSTSAQPFVFLAGGKKASKVKPSTGVIGKRNKVV